MYRYIVDVNWLKEWKKYVGYNFLYESSAGQEYANPGPVETSILLKGKYMIAFNPVM